MKVHLGGLVFLIALTCIALALVIWGSQPSTPHNNKPSDDFQDAQAARAAAVEPSITPAQLTLGKPVVNSIGMTLAPIPAGEFLMGSRGPGPSSNYFDEQPQHLVKITKPFYLSAFEVTQQQYEQVMGVRPWQGKRGVPEGSNYPATYVSWNDAVAFCRKLSEQEDAKYRLPTEAEWEYACRAGTTTAYSFGDDTSRLGKYAWYAENTVDYAHRVGQKLPNPWGLYDMHGNAREACHDWYGPYGTAQVVQDPTGPTGGGIFVVCEVALSPLVRLASAPHTVASFPRRIATVPVVFGH